MSPASGEPGSPVVAVKVKAWQFSTTIWTGLSLLLGGAADAVINAILPYLLSDEPLSIEKLWRPALVAALGAFVAWRRKTDNSVIGSGATAS
jgi:hypothetical protein